MAYAAEIRERADWIESSTLSTILQSFFIARAHFELNEPRSHHFYLREAIGMALDQELHLESTYARANPIQAICQRRTFALLFITERGLSILRNKPIQIIRLPFLPTELFEDENPSILAGFQCLCRLFGLLDAKFVELWRNYLPEDNNFATSLQNIATIQHSLNAMSFETSDLTDIQRADVLVTQQWLRLIFWQASMRQGLVSSASLDPAFLYDYPTTIAKRLCDVMTKLPITAILVHGLGIVCMISHFTICKIANLLSSLRRYLRSPTL